MKKFAIIIDFLASGCWFLCSIFDIASIVSNGCSTKNILLLVLHVVCAVLFLISGILNIKSNK